MQRNLKTIAILCLTLSIAPLLCAQELLLEDQPNATAPTFFGETGLFQTTSGSTVEKGRFSFGAYLNSWRYALAPAPELAPRSGRALDDAVASEDRMSASIGYGINDRWEVDLQFPLVALQGNDGDRAGYMLGYPYVGKFSESDVGNLHLGTKFGLLSPENSHKLAVLAFIDFNTGHEDSGIATGNSDYGAGLAWNKSVYYISGTFMNRGRRDSSNSPSGMQFQVSDEFRADFGINIPLRRFGATNWITEVNTVWYTSGERQPDDIVSISTGIRHWMGNTPWGFSAAIRDNVTAALGDTGTNGFGFLAGIHYSPMRTASVAPPPPPPVSVPLPPPVPTIAKEPEPVAAPQGPQELRTDKVGFEKDSARVTNIGKALLDDVALRMRQEPAATAVVTGFAGTGESMGPDNDLDQRRAEAVRDYLVSRHKIDASRISVEAGGATDGMADTMVAMVKLIVP